MKFQERFLVVLEQDIEAPVTADTAGGDGRAAEQGAMSDSLEKGTRPEDFDVPVPASSVNEELKRKQIAELKTWISTIDAFIEFLNSPTPHSMQTKLHAAGCDTLFDDIALSETKKISRLAAELSSLSESMKGYLISSNNV